MKEIISPLTGKSNTRSVAFLDASIIKRKYKSDFNIDINRFFGDLQKIEIVECKDSKLLFYYPFSLVSDGEFYTQLGVSYSNYYSPWKWEHEKVFMLLKKNQNVLEIGCGEGSFLSMLKKNDINGIGLDFNLKAVEDGKLNGLQIFSESVVDFSKNNFEKFDSVCAFQLFEHVNSVGEILKSSIDCLKKGGLFCVGVPNNDSFYFKKDPYHTLNLPPHHMLLWNKSSLVYLASLFDLDLVNIESEPVNKIQRSMMYKIWLNSLLGETKVSKFIHILTRSVVKNLPLFNGMGITIMAVFRKK